MSGNDKAAEMRRRFPYATSVAAAHRDVFGDGVKILHAQEGDDQIGRSMDNVRGKWLHAGQMVLNTKEMQKKQTKGRK